jgi:hypothetical protein
VYKYAQTINGIFSQNKENAEIAAGITLAD